MTLSGVSFTFRPSLNLISLEGSDVYQELVRVAAFWTRSLEGYTWRPGHGRDSLGHHPWAKGSGESLRWGMAILHVCQCWLREHRFLPQSVGLSRIQIISLTQGVPEGRISKIATIRILPSQFLLHFHVTWKHVSLIFPTLAKSLRMYTSDWIMLSTQGWSRALIIVFKAHLIWPLGNSMTSFLLLIPSAPATLTSSYSSDIPHQLLLRTWAQPAWNASVLRV